jgi:hypothetical protein
MRDDQPRNPPFFDQLELTLELLRQEEDWPDFGEPEVLPPNVIRFRPRVCRSHTFAPSWTPRRSLSISPAQWFN